MTTTTRSLRRRAGAAGASVLAVVLLAAGCSSDSPSSSPSNSISISIPGDAVATGIAWTDCDDGFQCATVTVPLDWDDPDGETIDLAVVKHPASKPDQRIGTILTDPGGPGDTGVGFVRGAADILDGWGDGRFDWIGWDPRGTHASSPVDCFGSDEATAAFWDGVVIPTDEAEAHAYVDKVTQLAQTCGDAQGALLSHISTVDTVRDMDHIRELLGEDQITYVGTSYGTLIGQVYANMFPEHVRAMMLDGVVDPEAYYADAEQRIYSNSASVQEVFEQFLALCDEAGAERCALAGHGETAAARVDALLARLRQAPLPAPSGDPAATLTFSDVVASSFPAMRTRDNWPSFAEQLNAAAEGDGTELALAAAPFYEIGFWQEMTKSNAISCLDAPASKPISDWPSVIGAVDELSPLAVNVQGWGLWAMCAAGWPAGSDTYSGPWDEQTDVPILLIGTTHDPNTAYQNAVRSADLLGNAVLLTHDGYSHVSTWDDSACIEAWRPRYLVDLETPPPGTVCPADKKPFF